MKPAMFWIAVVFATLPLFEARAHDPHQEAVYLATTPNPNVGGIGAGSSATRGLNQNVFQAVQSIILRDHIWSDTHITICFGPDSAVHQRAALVQKIITIASEWQEGTKLQLDFGIPGPRICADANSANIRIDVENPPDGNGLFQSLIGNEAASASISGFEPFSATLLFPEGDPYYANEAVIRFYVLHEFGHALGAEHEHQRVDCKYNYNYIASHFGFPSASDAKSNMEQIFSTPSSAYPSGKAILTKLTVETNVDYYTPMKYNLSTKNVPSGDDPNVYLEGTRSTCYRTGWVSQLTAYDHAGIQLAYSAPTVATAGLIAALSKPSGFASLPTPLQKRLTEPALGRGTLRELADANALVAPSAKSHPTMFRELQLMQSSSKAVAAVKQAIQQRTRE
jgi:hypothetical protein